MKRIIAISALTAVACVGFGSVAHAGDTSTHTGTVAKTCAVGAVDGVMNPVTNTIVGDGGFTGNFPKVITSATGTGTPGKFVTLCNTDPSSISLAVGAAGVGVPPGQTGHTTTIGLAATGTVYDAAFLASTTLPASSTTVAHAFSDQKTDLNVSATITAANGKVLAGGATGTYAVPVTATLTP